MPAPNETASIDKPQNLDAASPDAASNAKSPRPLKPKRPFWRKKRFQIPFCLFAVFPLLLVVAVKLLYFNGVKLKPSPETTGFVEPLTPDGNVDFTRIYEERQPTWIGEPENGFRQIAQAFGPDVSDWPHTEPLRWETLQTSELYEQEWRPLCEKLNLDPTACPVFLNRLELTSYLRLNGISGTEPDVEPDAAYGLVWVGDEQRPARVDYNAAQFCSDAVAKFPWTAEEFPVAARWLEENADRYAVYESAINAPRYVAPRYLPFDENRRLASRLFALDRAEQIALDLAVRANFRLGTGDVDGALEDRRLVFRLARHIFDDPNALLTCVSNGFKVYQIGASIRIGANPNAPPTPEQWARAAEIHRETLGEYDFDAAWRRTYENERFLAVAGMSRLFTEPLDRLSPPSERWHYRFLRGLDANYAMQIFNQLFPPLQNGAVPQSEPGDDALSPELRLYLTSKEGLTNDDVASIITRLFSPNRKKRAENWTYHLNILCEDRYDAYSFFFLPPFHMARRLFDAAENFSRVQTLQLATLRYQAETGTLPPAFTVDASGKPLHSWRVLILPYINDETKALYEQIQLDEPWDSPHNRQFHAQAPSVFRRAQDRTAPPEVAAFSAIVGPNSLYNESGVGVDLLELARGSKPAALSQALIVERKTPIDWMRPDAEILETTAFEDGINGAARELPGPPSANGIGSSLGSAPRNDDLISSLDVYDAYALIATADGAAVKFHESLTKRYETSDDEHVDPVERASQFEGETLDELILGVKPMRRLFLETITPETPTF